MTFGVLNVPMGWGGGVTGLGLSPKFYHFLRLFLNKILHFLIPLVAKVCGVCGSPATEVQHYGSISCYSCRSVPDCKSDDEGGGGSGGGGGHEDDYVQPLTIIVGKCAMLISSGIISSQMLRLF